MNTFFYAFLTHDRYQLDGMSVFVVFPFMMFACVYRRSCSFVPLKIKYRLPRNCFFSLLYEMNQRKCFENLVAFFR